MLHRVKKEKDINKDKWIGIGGHFEGTESPEECLLREVREETGLTLTDYRYRGIVTFVSGDSCLEYMSLYTATGYKGELKECDEGTLEWIPKESVYDLNLWAGDKLFFRLLELPAKLRAILPQGLVLGLRIQQEFQEFFTAQFLNFFIGHGVLPSFMNKNTARISLRLRRREIPYAAEHTP